MLEETIYSVKLTIPSSYSIGNQHITFHKKGAGKFSLSEAIWFLLMPSLSVPVPFGSDTLTAPTLPGSARAAAWKCYIRSLPVQGSAAVSTGTWWVYAAPPSQLQHFWVWECQMFCTDKTQLQHQSWQE